jgi:hypothetical protein
MTNFDDSRMIFLSAELTPKPLVVRELLPLAQALDDGVLSPQAEVLCLAFGGSVLTLAVFEMMYHHVAQGEVHTQPWVLSLCMLCNTGNVFSPVVDGEVLHFSARAIYDGMMMLVDEETLSCWNHITGECQYGVHRGKQLTLLSDARHMSATQALASHSEAIFIKAVLTPKREAIATEHNAFRKDPHSNTLFLDSGISTMGELDPRLPYLEMGLGIWTDTTQRYYSFKHLIAADNVVFDRVDGQPLVVYVDPETSVPCAVYLDAQQGRWEGNKLRLHGGIEIHNGVVYDANRTRLAVKHPLQLFMRWFGFAFTFPNCEIFGV